MERWLPVPGYGGRYDVSDQGRIRSAPRRRTRGGIRVPSLTYGYHSVLLYNGSKPGKRESVHRLVLLAFVGPAPEERPQAAHKNGNRTDNRLSNLYWASREENTADRCLHGKMALAMKLRRSLSDDDAAFIRANYKVIKQRDLANMFGVHRGTIQRIHSGERY